MTRIIIENATILTLDDVDTFYFPGRLEIRDDKIYDIRDWTDSGFAEEYDSKTIRIDGTDKLDMPGFVDLHFHTAVAKVSIFQLLIAKILIIPFRVTMTISHCGSIWIRYGIPQSER